MHMTRSESLGATRCSADVGRAGRVLQRSSAWVLLCLVEACKQAVRMLWGPDAGGSARRSSRLHEQYEVDQLSAADNIQLAPCLLRRYMLSGLSLAS